MDWITIISTVIGGTCTILGGIFAYQVDSSNRKKHAASVLYYDLKSIENYLKAENSSVNIRYFSEWQSIVAECSFLTIENVEVLYRVYDLVYDYNYHYGKIENDKAVTKADIPQYKDLRKVIFESSRELQDKNKYSAEYKKLLEILQKKQK